MTKALDLCFLHGDHDLTVLYL